MSATETQLKAIAARGNVLMVAGAGTGKTHTLVERCLSCLVEERPRASLDEILMVTFTEAAAAEMRQRIRKRLEEELMHHPEDPHWQEQLALFETAQIGTLHSFCLQLIREHFYQLELDPQLSVLAEEEARLLAEETLDALFQTHYAGRGAAAIAVQQLIQTQGRGWDKPIRELVLHVYHYTQTLPDPAGWFHDQKQALANPVPAVWKEWFASLLADWCEESHQSLGAHKYSNDIASNCSTLLEKLKSAPSPKEVAALLKDLAAAGSNCPHGKKGLWLDPLKPMLEEARFLSSLASSEEGRPDPLAEDWSWVRAEMTTLLRLAEEFTADFAEAKHELGVVDFHDLEQHALRLLWDARSRQPTPVAQHWRQQLRFIFVDEYQDINAAQDQIIQALSREGASANRFLVGDVKQSIYRFRLANPKIFQRYAENWQGQQGVTIPLVDNFRSRESLLQAVNSLFKDIMKPEIGGLLYDQSAELRFGSPGTRGALSAAANAGPRVELHLRPRSGNGQEDPEEQEGLAEVRDLEESDKEARLAATRILELRQQKHLVWDSSLNEFRALDWQDIAVLLRSPARKAESYAKEFARLQIPLQVASGGFYESSEISDLVSLLQVLDNPLQDIPVIAVLHSPLVGLAVDELALIRLALPRGHYWTALIRWAKTHERQRPSQPQAASGGTDLTLGSAERDNGDPLTSPDVERTYVKVTRFLVRFADWRRLARQVSLSRCLEAVLSETHYAEWLLTQPRGEQRQANVKRLVGLAEQFDQFQRQGLFRFLRFTEAQKSAGVEPEVGSTAQRNAVRLISIHQSKGLEFPVVFLADLGKRFNFADLRAELILDEQYGLCPQVKPPQTGKRYPSLPYWLARRRQLRELLGEEMRLLYVAMTRARDTLLLSCSVPSKRLTELPSPAEKPSLQGILNARSYADWILMCWGQTFSAETSDAVAGGNEWLRWFIHEDAELVSAPEKIQESTANESPLLADSEVWDQLEKKLSWKYRFEASTLQPAKASVSELRRQAVEMDETSGDLLPLLRSDPGPRVKKISGRNPGRSGRAADVGTLHHLFLQLVDLEKTSDRESLMQDAARLQRLAALSAPEIELLDFGNLAAFWESELGRTIRSQSRFVERELAFTARFSPAELATITNTAPKSDLEGEFVVVQGVADLVLLLPDQIGLIDFKTDTVTETELPERVKRYRPQMVLYAKALSRIYQRPVTESWLCFLYCRKQIKVPPEE